MTLHFRSGLMMVMVTKIPLNHKTDIKAHVMKLDQVKKWFHKYMVWIWITVLLETQPKSQAKKSYSEKQVFS